MAAYRPDVIGPWPVADANASSHRAWSGMIPSFVQTLNTGNPYVIYNNKSPNPDEAHILSLIHILTLPTTPYV